MPQENQNLKDEIEYFKYSFEQAQNLVEFADSKASILLAVHTLVFSIYISVLLLNLKGISNPNWWMIAGIVFGAFFFLAIGSSIVITGGVIIPRDAKDNDSLFYYKTIAAHDSSDEYYRHFTELKQDGIAKGLAHQSYNVSIIADKKMRYIRNSIYLMYGYLTLILLSSIFLIIGLKQ